ncbi:MAG: DUF6163 family protein [Beijerinckiaceae bacterium]
MWPFSHSVPVQTKPVEQAGPRDIIAGDAAARVRTRWTRLLIFYLRTLALLALVRGLVDWARIIGFVGPENMFEQAPLTWQTTIALYAVLNCVSAVGLWLASAWGAVLWLIVTLCEVLLPWTIAGTVRDASLSDALLLSLAALYVLLTWLSARERRAHP